MLDPVTLLTLGSGIASSVFKFTSGQSEAAQANRAAADQYRQRLKIRENQYIQDNILYGNRISRYQDQLYENRTAAGRAYEGEQNRLNEIYRTARFNTQARDIQAMQGLGRAAASGRTGASALRSSDNVYSQFGRNQAIQAQSLMGAQQAYGANTRDIRRKLAAGNRAAFYNVGPAPTPGVMPLAPTAVQGPSVFSLGTDLLGVASSGLGMENEIRTARGQKPLFS
jgi:hypothetical protein